MRTSKFFRNGQWPYQKDKKNKATYQSTIPPRDLKFWIVVILLTAVMAGLVYVLITVS